SIQYTADHRIKDDIRDVDVDDLLQRFQQIELKTYGYTDEWRQVRKMAGDPHVRGVIAQQVEQIFPEYVEIIPNFTLPDKNFSMLNFHQVDKVAMALDLLGAVQAQHKRFTVAPNAPASSGSVFVSTADAGSYAAAVADGGSGNLTVSTGTSATGTSGALNLTTGFAAAAGGGAVTLSVGDSAVSEGAEILLTSENISVMAGSVVGAGLKGGDTRISGGAATAASSGIGGAVILQGGAGTVASGGVNVMSADVTAVGEGESGSISLRSGNVVSGKSTSASGGIAAATGDAQTAGDISLSVGVSLVGPGGSVSLAAGRGAGAA
ncbi:unnamed protein product, partial [Phaeothamnion confervicola]